MSGRLRALDPVLESLREWSPVYRRWSGHPCRAGGLGVGLAPWSAVDEGRLSRARELVDGGLAELSGRLDRWGAGISEAGLAVRAVAFGGSLSEPAAGRCAVVARVLEGYAERGASLSVVVSRVADGVGARADALVRSVLREADGLDSAARYASVRLVQQEIDVADASVAGVVEPERWRPLDDLVDAYGAVLEAVRAGLGAFDRWIDDEVGEVFGSGEAVEPASDPTWVWRRWRAIPLDDDIEPGTGPRLPSMEGTRTDSWVGVRLPEMPDPPR